MLGYFSQFLEKLLQHNPNTSTIIQEDFKQMSSILMQDPSDLEKIHAFLNFLHLKCKLFILWFFHL